MTCKELDMGLHAEMVRGGHHDHAWAVLQAMRVGDNKRVRLIQSCWLHAVEATWLQFQYRAMRSKARAQLWLGRKASA
jgi:hypothetical protein